MSEVEHTSFATNAPTFNPSNRRFGDCALVEIIHLHDCLRGALTTLRNDVTEFSKQFASSTPDCSSTIKNSLSKSSLSTIDDLERRIASRFQVIWSVFKAHSAAEDEFIWPALREKLEKGHHHDLKVVTDSDVGKSGIAEEEYVEDHENEERMFTQMNDLLSQLRAMLCMHRKKSRQVRSKSIPTYVNPSTTEAYSVNNTVLYQSPVEEQEALHKVSLTLKNLIAKLFHHLHKHLEKEEEHCLPLVKEHMTDGEIKDLVGRIMGQRSSDMITQILNLAMQNLPKDDREEMVQYMKQAMVGTFFERWLKMGGWAESKDEKEVKTKVKNNNVVSKDISGKDEAVSKKRKHSFHDVKEHILGDTTTGRSRSYSTSSTCSKDEMEKLIRTVMVNPTLTPIQKNTTIQRLQDSFWKSKKEEVLKVQKKGRKKDEIFETASDGPTETDLADYDAAKGDQTQRRMTSIVQQPKTLTTGKRNRRPLKYFKINEEGKPFELWSSNSVNSEENVFPLFSASELAPTFHDGATGAVLGCPHYARACKLRHPTSGRLYTCRLCCEQDRDIPLKNHDSHLDRYAVTEVMCMQCTTLQPSSNDYCMNPDCDSEKKPFSRYHCKICNFFDDTPNKSIYHCPFCNVCRSGKGLGIDFRHCMKCNACVSLSETVPHICIPQRLQGSCPICHEVMFESTEPLRGLKCGHVMHLSCYNGYIRTGQAYTCPLCKKSVEDMQEYFEKLDSAVRMQPMPKAYENTRSVIYCQDCGKHGEVPYHFVGRKCSHCGSYNTREIERKSE